jgi:ADP-ribose pyrophosphatase YjhB (NUDIX family)
METLNHAFDDKLRVRVCGICLQNNAMLLVRHRGLYADHDFWAPPGGGLILGETVKNCLKREFKEETGLEIKVGRFLFINEFLQMPLHAVELFFEVEITGGNLIQGTDPELETNNQLISEVGFKTLPELNAIPLNQKHTILYELVNFDDIFIPENRFL